MQGRPDTDGERIRLEKRWLELTRSILPGMAKERGWPIHADHCFQRVLLDAACGERWYGRIVGRPAYKAANDMILVRAVTFGEQVAEGAELLPSLNRQSLQYRGKL